MYCGNCGTKLPEGAVFCPDCGTRTESGTPADCLHRPEPQFQAAPQPQQRTQTQDSRDRPVYAQAAQQEQGAANARPAGAGGENTVPPQRHRHFPFGTIVAAVILVAAVVMLFSNGGEDPVNDLKGITFDSFDTTCTLGEAVSRNTSHTEWKSQKESDGSYVVTVGCVEKMYGMSLKVEFSVTYTDDWVYGQPQAVYFSGDRYTDSTSIAAAMMLLYGQLDEQGLSELMAYDMLWDVFG